MEAKESDQRGSSHLRAAAEKNHDGMADDGNLSGHLRAHRGGEEGQLVPGQQIAAEAESHDQKEQQHAGDPCQLAGLAVGLEKQDAEHVGKGGEDHQIGGPGVDGTNQPAKLHAGHDVLHAFEGLVGAGTVIEQQQDAGEHLDHEEKERDAPEEVPVGQLVRGNGLMTEWGQDSVQIEAFIEPAKEGAEHGHASPFRLTKISSPRT